MQNIANGESTGALTISDDTFAREYNETLVHQVVVAYLAKARAGTSAQKTRSEVSGGGAKPWRQKGTGRARAGTIRSPIWRTGGVTFASKTRSYDQKVNRKMYRAAMKVIVSQLVRKERLIVVEELALENPKTKELVAALSGINSSKILLVDETLSENIFLASRNIPGVSAVDVEAVDPVSLVSNETIIMTSAAVKKLEEKLA
ncbi:MAG: 50S ribosomal protein L4 [Gammaproteobacteria bacterium]|nr:MAG: 50S ribosomal protein L4 [Gammaproteobacteria bacterium]